MTSIYTRTIIPAIFEKYLQKQHGSFNNEEPMTRANWI